jgi:uncharacterized protein with putative carbohydrate binding module
MPAEVDPDDLKTSAHAGLNHAGIPGVGDLTTAAHGSLDHTGITGVGLSLAQSLLLPKGWGHATWKPNPDVSGGTDFFTSDSLYCRPAQVGSTTLSVLADNNGPHVFFPGSAFGAGAYQATSNQGVTKGSKPRLVAKVSVAMGSGSVNSTGYITVGFQTSAGTPVAQPDSIWFEVGYFPTGAVTVKLNRRISVSTVTVDTGFTPTAGAVYYYVIEFTGVNDVTCTIYDASFAVVYTTSFTGAGNVPQFSEAFKAINFEHFGDGAANSANFYFSQLSLGT